MLELANSEPVERLDASDLSASDPTASDAAEIDPSHMTPSAPRVGLIRRGFRGVGWLIWTAFRIASLIVLLAILAAIPIFQLVTFGYLLDVSGRLARGGRFRDALPSLDAAGKIGLAGCGLFLAALPVQLLVHWESVAQLIQPGSAQAVTMRILAIGAAIAGTVYLLWVWVRGGQLRHYLWPQPIRFLRQGWRPSTYREMPDKLWETTVSLELPRLFWLGVRGAIGTLVWLAPAMIIIAANRNGETGLAGLVGGLSLLALGVVLLYLPMLQTHFAAENRLSALFELRKVRRLYRRAPWAWLLAMISGLVILPLPLYLLKIEATPQEVVWLPTLVFVAFILPARIAEGLAIRRANRLPDPTSWWAFFSRWIVRFLMVGVVAIYLTFVTLSQFTSWDGLQTWVQQHAVLIPIPFLGGT
ncbi:DUF4013 domain-containing protein [Stieleria varia]|nr:DUF4013 domain-containing protein [Stieleria varia]